MEIEMEKNKNWKKATGRQFQGFKQQLQGAEQHHTVTEDEGSWHQDFYFVQLADTQFGFFHDNESWEEDLELSRLVVEKINMMKPPPRFVVVCGDLIHGFPHEAVGEQQTKDFKQVFGKVKDQIELICVCGNHDVGNHPTQETINLWNSRYGDDYFQFWYGGVHCIVLNSQLYSVDSNLKEDQKNWLRKTLKEGQGKCIHRIVFQHQPWFLFDEDEADSYWNIPMKERREGLELLEENDVRLVLAGHYHRNAVGVTSKGLEMVTSGPVGGTLGEGVSGLRIVKVSREKITHQYYPLKEAPENVYDITTS